MGVLRRCCRLPRLVKTSCLFSILFFTVLHMIKLNDIEEQEGDSAKYNHESLSKAQPPGEGLLDKLVKNVSARGERRGENSGARVAQVQTAAPQRATPKEYSEDEIKVIFDRLVTDKVADPSAPGARGAAMKIDVDALSEEEAREYYKGWELHGFNLYASDRISLQRDTPPVPDAECADITFLPQLPDTSVIIIFYNEALSTLLRTVYSVINTTPPALLREIILVDDFSDYEELQAPLEQYIARTWRKVQLRRTARRSGLIQARLYGIKFATAQTITFLDAHCECVPGWIEPLLDQVARNASTVATPIIDQITFDTFEHRAYSGATAAVGTFTWMLNFDWIYTANSEYRRRPTPLSPTRSATMAGGLFTIHQTLFRRLGYYDPQLQLYGAENLELSFKIWMCGGQLVQMPCSHVGHVFRSRTPYTESTHSQTAIMRNRMRVAEVWMDDYKQLFYSFTQPEQINIGDVTGRKRLRSELKCGSFESYLKLVAPERLIPLSFTAFGMVRSAQKEEHGLDVCLFANYHKSVDNGAHVPLAAKRCDMYDKYLVFVLGEASQKIQIDLLCLYIRNDNRLEMKACSLVSDTWLYDQDGHVRHAGRGTCLQMDSTGRHVTAEACAESADQRWHWNRQ